MFSLLLSLMQPAFAQDSIAIIEMNSSTSDVGELYDIYRMNLETHLKRGLDPEAFDIITRDNVIPLMEKLKTMTDCANANCEIELAKNLGAKYVLTSEHSFYSQTGTHYLTIRAHDVEENRLVAIQEFDYKKESEAFDINPYVIVNGLNDLVPKKKVDLTPRKMTFPDIPPPPMPKAKDVGNVLLASAIVAPIVYLFADNISNIASK